MRPSPVSRLLLAAALTAAASQLPVRAQSQDHPGHYDAADIEAGSRLYASQCALCHGATGDVVAGVDLRRGQFRRAMSDQDIAAVIANGVPVAGMPGFRFEAREVEGLVAFIRAGFDVSGTSVTLGDPARGRAVFSGNGHCGSCHRVNGVGPRVAPDLSDIGALRTPVALQRSLVSPSTAMLPINRPVRIVTRDGRRINGRRLNEDTYTVQIIDQDERLLSLDKVDLREFEVGTASPMPSAADTLSGGEVADLVAYLLTLRGL